MAIKDGNLILTYPRGSAVLDFNDKGDFATGFPFGGIKYQCNAQDGCRGFTVTNGRVRNLKFTRLPGAPYR